MMNPRTLAVLTMALSPLACESREPSLSAAPLHSTRGGEVFTVGVLVDDASPAKANFTAAAELAERQINRGLRRTRLGHRLAVVVASYGAGQAQNAAIDLINNQGALAVVSDISGNTAAVNRLNYESPLRIVRQVPVTCYQCSSAFFNDPTQADAGFADPDNWLFRTFFNAQFESAVQVQLVINRPQGGDFNGDGHLKIVAYYDSFHLSAATTLPALVDSLHPGPHSVKLIAKTLPSTAATRAEELGQVFDAGPDGHLPDAVYLAFLPQNASEALSDYQAHPFAPKPPAQANNGVRRNFLLPALIASGGEALEGSSVLSVASSRSGRLFRSAFVAATGEEPELTASFLYDAVVAQAIAIGVARSAGPISPENIRASFPAINAERGRVIRPRPRGFKLAARRILRHRPIDYSGASSSLDLTEAGEMYPDLVHWKIEAGQFVELERYACDPQTPNCQIRGERPRRASDEGSRR
jgi:hypothetical protein